MSEIMAKKIARLEAENAEMKAAIDLSEVEGSITDNGNLWRFWAKKCREVSHNTKQARAEAYAEALEAAEKAIVEPISAYVYDVLYKMRIPATSHSHQKTFEPAQSAIRALPNPYLYNDGKGVG